MKTILVPTDFSKNSLNAIDYAVALAKKKRAKIILLNTYHHAPPAVDIPTPSDVINSLRIDSISKLETICSEIIKRKKVKCEYISRFDLAVPGIVNVIKEKKADIVIMGTKGASEVKKLLIGSNTANVIEKATCPVISIPEGAVFNGIKKILFATDYNESDINVIKKIVELAKMFDAKITILHISDGEFNHFSENAYLKEFKNKVQKKIHYSKISYKLTEGKRLENALQDEIDKTNPDLLVMSTERRNLLEKLFGSSATKRMVYRSEIPLMVFHHKRKSVVFI